MSPYIIVEGPFLAAVEMFEELEFDAQDKREQALLVIRQVYNRDTKEGKQAYEKAEKNIEQTYQDERRQALAAFLETYHLDLAEQDNPCSDEEPPKETPS
ncbi:hypothetical protein [Candidatus Bathycorpusculum sp.]|uniref:hypothetical protein n=1 Tax=Candidatus Bathycorpusculum sp. TaxID=2994959 RepID=UPI002835D889|nr:hypothetical protein [Candidatus Termitimicrobium sp.]MCL2432082.1 hypothetical protein [Candidatus Termitimicrobium sp.]